MHILQIDKHTSGLQLRVTGQSYFPDLASSEPEIFVSTRLYGTGANRYGTDIANTFLLNEPAG